jgi:Cu+-exporting ATPase
MLGFAAFAALLILYLGILAAISGWAFAIGQLRDFWGYIVTLGAGFGVQVALYLRLRQVLVHNARSGAVMATTGTTSTAAMVSCCAHYLANAAPVLGAAGLVTFAAQYQVELFWIGLAFNAAGIAYIGSKLRNAIQDHARCVTA